MPIFVDFYQEDSVSILEMIYHAHFFHMFFALLEQARDDGNLMKIQHDLFITGGLFKAVTMTCIH